MEVIQSHDYREAGQRAKEIRRLHGDALSEEQSVGLDIQARRTDTLKKIEAVKDEKFAVFDKTDPRIGGWTQTDTREMGLAAHVLDNPELAMDVAAHEIKHKKTYKFYSMGKDVYLEQSHHDVLKDRLQSIGIDMGNIRWLEGFTELSKAHEHGGTEGCAYNAQDVPAAGQLDRLVREFTGFSLIDDFDANDLPSFKNHLEKLCESLLAEKALDNLEAENSEFGGIRNEVKARYRVVRPAISDLKHAEKVMAKIAKESLQLRYLHDFLTQPANENGRITIEAIAA